MSREKCGCGSGAQEVACGGMECGTLRQPRTPQVVSMNVKALENQLHAEGFRHTFLWQDGPHAFYPDHTHAGETAHIILDGEMSLTQEGTTGTYKKGDRVDVPANAVHCAKMGPHGCRYLIGEK